MTPVTPRPPIERRLADAGLPPLPRTAWLEIDLDALRGQPRRAARPGRPGRARPTGRQGRRLRPRRGPGRARARGGRRRRVLRGRLRRGDRAARGRRPRADPRPLSRSRRRSPPRPPERGIAVAGRRSLPALAATIDAAARLDPLRPLAGRARGRDRSRSWRLRRSPRSPTPRATSRRSRGLRLAGLWTHFQAAEDPAITAAQVAAYDAAVDGDRATAGIGLPSAPRRRQRGAAHRRHAGLRRRAARAGDLRPRPRRARCRRAPPRADRAARSWRSSRGPSASRTCRPAGASATARRSGRPGRAGSRRCPLGYGDGWSRALSNRARRHRPRPAGCRWSGNVAMDAVMADVTDVPGPPVDTDRRVRAASGWSGDERISVADLAQARTTNSWEVVTAMSRRLASGVPCRGGAGRSADAHRAERVGLGAHRALERRHLRPGGRRHRERGQSVAVDVDRGRRRAQARRR